MYNLRLRNKEFVTCQNIEIQFKKQLNPKIRYLNGLYSIG